MGRRTTRLAWLAVAIVVTAAGCVWPGVGPERVPTVIGVIADQEFGPAGVRIFTLDDGREVRLPMSAEVVAGGVVYQVGDLLLSDPQADPPWFLAARRDEIWQGIDLCYRLFVGYAEERDGTIITREGLVIQKAPGYDPGPVEGDRYDSPRGTLFCLDEEGRALAASY